jgi:hypothetical protein
MPLYLRLKNAQGTRSIVIALARHVAVRAIPVKGGILHWNVHPLVVMAVPNTPSMVVASGV